MSNVVKINNTDLSVKEFRNQRVVTFREIDEVHNRSEGTAGRNFRKNRDKFIQNEDYFEINQPDEIRRLGFERPQGGNPGKVILITESGYLMLVKSFTDDLAWEVQRQLVNVYFRAKEIKSIAPEKKKEIEARYNNSLARKANILLKIANSPGINARYKQVLQSQASAIIAGKPLLPLPEADKPTLTAKEVGDRLGISANMVGRLAAKHDLKVPKYGKLFHDKSPYSGKEVETFRYYEEVIPELERVLGLQEGY